MSLKVISLLLKITFEIASIVIVNEMTKDERNSAVSSLCRAMYDGLFKKMEVVGKVEVVTGVVNLFFT